MSDANLLPAYITGQQSTWTSVYVRSRRATATCDRDDKSGTRLFESPM